VDGAKCSGSIFSCELTCNDAQVNRLNIVEQLLDFGVDGIITDGELLFIAKT
jgi:hypothetical protein